MSPAPEAGIKQRIPWPIKFAVKLLLGAARVDYRRLKRAGVVEHGRMEDAGFASDIFEQHVGVPMRARGLAAGGRLLEIGPGDSVATGVLGRAFGFDAVTLIDAGRFADLAPGALRRLFAALGAAAPALADGAGESEALAALQVRGIDYLTDGVRSLAALPGGSVRYAFSNTVLQHVHRSDLPALVAELGRVHEPGGFASHSAVLTDHFSGGFMNHALPAWFMESALVKRAHLYTNRVPPLEYVRLFESAGFEIRSLTVDYFDPDGPSSCEYHTAAEFRGAADRRVLRTVFLLQKRSHANP
jgi:hypothetical protein